MHFASHYRWLVATRTFNLPCRYTVPLLDIGTDQGAWLSQIEAPLRVGLDLQSLRAAGPLLVQGDALTLPFPSESFGQIWAFDIIEHVPSDRQLVHEALRVLQPGGTLWLSTTAHKFFILPGGLLQRQFEQSWGHVRRGYTASSLQALAPSFAQVDVMEWNEPLFRWSYTGLYILSRIAPFVLPMLVERIYAWDKQRRSGTSGHLFARFLKPHTDTMGCVNV